MFEECLTSFLEKDVAEETVVDKIKKIIKGKIMDPAAGWKKVKEEQLINKYGLRFSSIQFLKKSYI